MTATAADPRARAATTSPPTERRPLLSSRRVTAALSHVYIWACLFVFVAPFLALLNYSITGPGGTYAVANFQYVLGSFGDNLVSSFQVAALTLILDLAVCLPAAYALVRFTFRGRRLIFSIFSLPLYVPGAVIGLSLILTYNFTYHISSIWGLVFAMAVGTFPLMLTPIVVAMKDLPLVFEEAAECLGASRWQAYRRIVLPLIGPGISAGLLLSFIIVFNEYLVTLFVHPPGLVTAPLRVFNLVRTAGLAPTTAALAVTLQLVSFVAVLIFFRAFGSRNLKGTYFV